MPLIHRKQYLILINKQNNDILKKIKFLLQSGFIPVSFLPTSGLFCKDATQIVNMINREG